MMVADIDSWEKFVKLFVEYPAYLALMLVIYWLIKIIQGKDAIIKDLTTISNEEAERNSKFLTLLEILVARKDRQK